MKTIRIELDKVGHRGKVLADGELLDNVRSVDIHSDAESLTIATVEVIVDETTVDLPFDQVVLEGVVFEHTLTHQLRQIIKAVETENQPELQKQAACARKMLMLLDQQESE